MDETRKAFEAWAQESGWGIDKMGPDEEWSEAYESATVRCMWRAWRAACAAEREACAAIADEYKYHMIAGSCAADIRARSKQ